MSRREADQLDAPAGEEGVAGKEERGVSLADKYQNAASISPLVLAARVLMCRPFAGDAAAISFTVLSALELLAGLTTTAMRLAVGTSSRKKLQMLSHQFAAEKINACYIAPGSSETGDKAKADGVLTDNKDYRRRLSCLFSNQTDFVTGRSNHIDLAANQVGGQFSTRSISFSAQR